MWEFLRSCSRRMTARREVFERRGWLRPKCSKSTNSQSCFVTSIFEKDARMLCLEVNTQQNAAQMIQHPQLNAAVFLTLIHNVHTPVALNFSRECRIGHWYSFRRGWPNFKFHLVNRTRMNKALRNAAIKQSSFRAPANAYNSRSLWKRWRRVIHHWGTQRLMIIPSVAWGVLFTSDISSDFDTPTAADVTLLRTSIKSPFWQSWHSTPRAGQRDPGWLLLQKTHFSVAVVE